MQPSHRPPVLTDLAVTLAITAVGLFLTWLYVDVGPWLRGLQ